MKKQVSAFAAANGISTHYSGNQRKMFLSGVGARRVASLIKDEYPNLEFKISYAK